MREKREKNFLKRDVSENIQYYVMMFPTLALIFLFNYVPLFGIVIAFQNYMAGKPFFGPKVEWVGLKWFKEFVNSFYFKRIIRNTVRINLMEIAIGFLVPIIFALLVNEIRNTKFKKITQTISYLPHFLSSVIAAGIVIRLISSDGVITKFINIIGSVAGFEVKSLTTSIEAFPWIYVLTGIWKGFGWASILYLSTISSVDPGLYEAAAIDGAGRLKRIWHITLPAMAPLITIKLIMEIGGLLGANTDLILNLYNPSVYESADVLGTFMYRETLQGGKFSYGTAAGLLMSGIGFVLTYTANTISRKFTDYSMW